MFLDLSPSVLSTISDQLIITVISSVTTLITGYVLLRERLVKNEMKVESVYDYINNRNETIENKIKDLKDDFTEFKEMSKETSKSLAENNNEIRELRILLRMVTERLQKNI